MSRGGGRDGRDARRDRPSAAEVAGAFYERYGTRIHRFCVRRLGEDDAPDAVQDTFLRAWLALRNGVEIRHPLPWLLTIADNVCVSRLRAQGARVVTSELSEDASIAPSASSGDVEGLTAALRELPDTQRQALVRRELQGLSYDEIGAELGVSRASVAGLLHRARRTVAESLRAALRGAPAFVPIPTVFRAGLMGNAAGSAVGSTAAIAVTVVQLTAPTPAAVPGPPASQPAHVEVDVAARSTLARTTPGAQPTRASHVSDKRVARTTIRVRAPRDPSPSPPNADTEVLVLRHLRPHWGPLLPAGEPPSDERPPAGAPPVPSPNTDTASGEAGAPTSADQSPDGAPDQPPSGSIDAAPENDGSDGPSKAAPGRGGPPGFAESGEPRGGSAASGSAPARDGEGGPPSPPPHSGEGDANGPLPSSGNGTLGGESPPWFGQEQGDPSGTASVPGPLHEGRSEGGPKRGTNA